MITIDRVSYAYPGAQQAVLDEFSASFPPAALTAITGANGCGKTTLTKLMTGIVRPLAGRVTIDGTDIAPLSLAEIGSLVGCVFQNPTHQLFSTSVREEVSFGLRNLGLSDAQIAERVRHALTCFDLEEREDDFPLSLSHGEKQRLMLAAVLALRPAYIVLDEPTTGLDVVRRRALGVSLRQIAESNGCGVIVVSHERAFVSRYADAEISMVPVGVAGAARRERQPEPQPQRRGGKAGTPRLARIDPRVKLLLMLCISTLAVVWRDPLWLASLLAFTCTVLAVGGVDLGTALRQIRGVLGVVALLFIVQCLFVRSGRRYSPSAPSPSSRSTAPPRLSVSRCGSRSWCSPPCCSSPAKHATTCSPSCSASCPTRSRSW
ncbi:MAG: ATP-binding cassette domain-containing protein [Actinobacteria bacterium]|nr:ATP-binding cassette domain-containing protein [Actinomycetota bacterium]